ncbi:hypothetical protein [Candidatus Palauibacter sp.]|uniref:hypothetical protein n=1 Tax=Candidatus Palauibacter sp. TaxID=3101350 RepID=UPI003B019652
MSIGTAGGDPAYELFRVGGAMRLSDGRIVVANAGTGELRVYDPDGIHLASWGGQGDGPGEFGPMAPGGPGAVAGRFADGQGCVPAAGSPSSPPMERSVAPSGCKAATRR